MKPTGLVVVDHTEDEWARRYRKSFARKGRENGAATYSREIVEHQVPVWELFAPPGTVISTCPLLSQVRDLPPAPMAVQYLHTIVHPDPLSQPREVVEALDCPVVFVTAYRVLHQLMRRSGYESVFVPMTVDATAVRTAVEPRSPRLDGPRALYFGNITAPREQEFQLLAPAFDACGWRLDVISDGRFNGRAVTQVEAWNLAAGYRYGVGVGRCALELHALGLRVIYSGAGFGGIATTPAEWEIQASANFGGSVTTFARWREDCIAAYELGLTDPPAVASEYGASVLRGELLGLRDREVLLAA